jgi:glutaredoxin
LPCSASPKRPRRAASIRSVVLYTAQGCHLCERAREVLDAEGVDYREIDITGNPELEAAHREWLPVVEIDGERAFVYRIPLEALRRKLVAQS